MKAIGLQVLPGTTAKEDCPSLVMVSACGGIGGGEAECFLVGGMTMNLVAGSFLGGPFCRLAHVNSS